MTAQPDGAYALSLDLRTTGAPPELGVLAHDLLGTVSLIGGIAGLVSEQWDVLSAERRDDLLARIQEYAAHTAGVLGSLARGLTPETAQALAESRPSH